MFRSLFRVVVVSVLALSLNILVVPAAQAGPQQPGKAVPGSTRNWLEEAMDWLNRIGGGEIKGFHQALKKMTANGGGITLGICIDPDGRPRPCR